MSKPNDTITPLYFGVHKIKPELRSESKPWELHVSQNHDGDAKAHCFGRPEGY